MWNLPKPWILAANGTAAGWGVMAVFSADYRIAVPTAKIGYTGALKTFGGAEGGGVIERLIPQMPYIHVADMLLTGRLLTAQEALDYHLINKIVEPEELIPKARAYAGELKRMPPIAVRNIKRALRHVHNQMLDQSIAASNEVGSTYFFTDDFREALEAWAEKREPVWKGR
jgi:enoyl-CoA hydratase